MSFYYSSIQHTHQTSNSFFHSAVATALHVFLQCLHTLPSFLRPSNNLQILLNAPSQKLLRHLPWTLPSLRQYIIVTNCLLTF